MATDTVAPSPPIHLLTQSINVVKKPKSRRNRTMHESDQSGLIKILKERVEDIKMAKRAVEQRKEEFASQLQATHEHLQESDRKARKKERSIRIKMFQQKQVAKRITQASTYAQVTDELRRRATGVEPTDRNPSTRASSRGVHRPSEMTVLEEDDDEDGLEVSDSAEEDDEDDFFDEKSLESRKQLLADIAEKGIKSNSTNTHSVPLIGENSFAEIGLNSQHEPKNNNEIEAAKMYEDMLNKIDRELNDQIVTQLTLKMGPETVNTVVYWQPLEDRLKIKVYCFHR